MYGEPGSANRLIHGENLAVMRSLLPKFAGRVACVFADPPYNTGSSFEHYDDGVEHAAWLAFMRERCEVMRDLLAEDGVCCVMLDESEAAYAKVMLDEVFGRRNYLNTITTTTNDPSGFKATGSAIFSTANYILMYAKQREAKPLRRVMVERAYDPAYRFVLADRDAPIERWTWERIRRVVAREHGFSTAAKAIAALGREAFLAEVARYAVQHASRVFRTAAIRGGAAHKRAATIARSRAERGRVFTHPGDDIADFYVLNGEQIVFYDRRLVEIDGRRVPGELLTDVWTDIAWNGLASEGGVAFKNGKKPELLMKRILELTTSEGDLVLDPFLGSGTTAAVAHKMRRRWIGIESGDQASTHALPRLRAVVEGEQSGISRLVGWTGGGDFTFESIATDR